MIPGLAERLAELRSTLADDTSPRNVMRVAEAHWLAGRAAEATSLLEPLVDITPSAIAPRVLLGWCYEDAGREEESRREFAAARSLDPANPYLKVPDLFSPPVQHPAFDESPASETPLDEIASFPGAGASLAEPEIVWDQAAPSAAAESELAEIEHSPEPPALSIAPQAGPEHAPLDPYAAERQAEPEAALTPEELREIPPVELVSATLGEIFERQGFDEKAIEIYREVVRRNPERGDLLARIEALEARGAGNEQA